MNIVRWRRDATLHGPGMPHDGPGDGSDPGAPGTLPNPAHQHSFVTLGTKTLYLCHLTMYGMEPHMYQVVLEVRLPGWADEIYRAERRAHPEDSYFLGNSPNDLFTLPEINSRARTWFLADVFRGIPRQKTYDHWPWADQKPVIANVRVEVARIVHYRLFSNNMRYPETLTYLLFGGGDEAHMTNWQTKEPDFDHILSLASAPGWLPERELEAGILIDLPNIPGDKVQCTNPLPKGTTYKVRYRAIEVAGAPRTIEAGPTFWFCTKVANNGGNPCPDADALCGSAPP